MACCITNPEKNQISGVVAEVQLLQYSRLEESDHGAYGLACQVSSWVAM